MKTKTLLLIVAVWSLIANFGLYLLPKDGYTLGMLTGVLFAVTIVLVGIAVYMFRKPEFV